MRNSARPARPGATPRWDARQRINQVWARGADLRITLQHCLQTKTRQIAHYNVNGMGQGLRNAELKSQI
jgi:hypothetical protein